MKGVPTGKMKRESHIFHLIERKGGRGGGGV